MQSQDKRSVQRFYSYFLAFKSSGTALHFVPGRQIIGLSFSFFLFFFLFKNILSFQIKPLFF